MLRKIVIAVLIIFIGIGLANAIQRRWPMLSSNPNTVAFSVALTTFNREIPQLNNVRVYYMPDDSWAAIVPVQYADGLAFYAVGNAKKRGDFICFLLTFGEHHSYCQTYDHSLVRGPVAKEPTGKELLDMMDTGFHDLTEAEQAVLDRMGVGNLSNLLNAKMSNLAVEQQWKHITAKE